MPQPADSIGNWDSTQLQKVVRELITIYAPDHLGGLTVDDLIVAGSLTVQGTIVLSRFLNINVIGASGQAGYANSWVNGGAPYFPAAYTNTADKWVRLRGAIKSGTLGLAAFVLPPGSRPSSTSRHAVVSNALFGIVDITSAGLVIPQSPSSNVLVSLDGIQFKAA
jgi:hypothetical protein